MQQRVEGSLHLFVEIQSNKKQKPERKGIEIVKFKVEDATQTTKDDKKNIKGIKTS